MKVHAYKRKRRPLTLRTKSFTFAYKNFTDMQSGELFFFSSIYIENCVKTFPFYRLSMVAPFAFMVIGLKRVKAKIVPPYLKILHALNCMLCILII